MPDLENPYALDLPPLEDPYAEQWPPPHWGYAQPDVPLQPGIGIPTAALDQAAAVIPPGPGQPQPPGPIETVQPGIGVPVTALDQAAAGLPPPTEASGQPPTPWQADAVSGVGKVPIDSRAPFKHEGLTEAPADDDAHLPWKTEGMAEADTWSDRDIAPDAMFKARTEELDQLQLTDPEGYAREKARFVQKQREQASIDELAAIKADREQMVRDEHMHQAKLKAADDARRKVDADAEVLANAEPHTWQQDASVFQRIAGVLAAVVGGLNAKNTGGRNLGLEALTHTIDSYAAKERDKLDRKQRDLTSRRQLVGDMYTRADTEYTHADAKRLAMWKMVERDLQVKIQQFDPEGQAAFNAAEMLQASRSEQEKILAQHAAAAAKQRELEIKAAHDANELALKAMHDQQEAKHWERGDKSDAIRAGADWTKAQAEANKTKAETEALKSDNSVRSPDYYEAQYGKAGRPPHEMSAKEYKGWIDNRTKVAEGTTKAFQAGQTQTGALAPDGQRYPDAPADQSGNAFVLKDGKTPFRVSDDVKRTKIDKINAAAQNLRNIADLVAIAKTKYGGASKFRGSKEYQDLVSLVSAADFEVYKAYDLGAPSAGDKAMAEAARGGKDITSFIYDATPGFESLANNAAMKLNTEMRAAGYDGKPVKLKSIQAKQAQERDYKQNRDVIDSDMIKSADPAIYGPAAQAALDSMSAAARQFREEADKGNDPTIARYGIAELAGKAQVLLKQGKADPDEVDRTLAGLRNQYRMAVDNDDLSDIETDRLMLKDFEGNATDEQKAALKGDE